MTDYYTETRRKKIREYQIDYLIEWILDKKEVPEKLLKNLGVKIINV
jgi:hypothetical protein